MKVSSSALLTIVLAAVLVASLFFMATRGLSGSIEKGAMQLQEYDPWCDVNDDGKISVADLVIVVGRVPSMGDPLTKAALTYDSGWVDITDKAGQYFNITHNLNSTDIIVDITGKTTIDGGVHQRHLGGTGYTPGWERTYGGASWDPAESGIQTSDRGYAIAGWTASFGAGQDDFWLVKTDWTGDILWNKTYGWIWTDQAYSVVQTVDGGYTIVGCTASFGAGQYDFWLVKTDSNGNMQWNQTYGGTDDDFAYSVVQASDGGYLMAGCTWSFGVSQDLWLVKTDSNGNMQWSRTYGGVGGDIANCVVQTSDGGYAIAGSTNSSGAGQYDFWLVKTDSNGNMQWNQTYGWIWTDQAYSVVQTSDGGYAIAGQGFMNLVKTDGNGNLKWLRKYFPGAARAVVEVSDGGYAIVGLDYLVRTDSNGNVQWSRTYGGAGWDDFMSVVPTEDGGYSIAGSTNSFGAGMWDFWLVKTGVESGLAWTDSTADTITLYRGATDAYWNYVRVRIWKIKENP
jgi:hypothetical protein